MKFLKKRSLLLLTAVLVLSSVLLPRQVSAVRDRKLFGKAHTMELSGEEIALQMPTLSEKLELLGRAVQDPELEVYTTSQQLAGTEAIRQDGAETIGQGETPSEVFAKAMGYLSEWGLLPEGFSTEGFQPASIISMFEDAEEQRQAAELFQTTLPVMETKQEREKAPNYLLD